MSKCTFCKTEIGVGLAVVEAGGRREPVDACRKCIGEYGLTTELVVADLPQPRGGGDIQLNLKGLRVTDDLLLIDYAVKLGARVGMYHPSN
ncbi:MAG: hypothetical protein WCT01_00915 [Candidatus Shapirobacteria bacterium]